MRIQLAGFTIITAALGFAGFTVFAAPISESCQTGGFALGCQAWTFKEFTVLEAIDKTAAAGGKVIELYSGQKFSPDKPGVVLDQNASEEVIAELKARLEKDGIRAVNFGVLPIPNNEAEARKIFDFAKKLGLYGITTESVESIDLIEKLVKEYNICVGFHDHPRRPNDPGYKMWDPNYVLSVVKNRDARIGSTADVGHWLRSGLDPVECLKILKGRIISVHLKDLNEKSPNAHDVPFGTGACNIPGILTELKHQKFAGNISIEYEYNWTNNVIDVAQCIGFVRGYGAK
ncbi:MAG: sugar phosphate isomerase/epimerase family protein [Limisphaerales bacterium]